MKLSELIRYATAGNNRDYYLCVDVDPLIEAKDKEIKKQAETIEHLTRYQLWSHGEIEQLQSKLDESISPVIESYQEALDQQKERILELQAEIERLKRDLILNIKPYNPLVDVANDLHEQIKKLEVENKRLKDALICAEETIGTWHGSIGWDLYQKSPEMKKIYEALSKSK